MKQITTIFILLTFFALLSCDPSMNGDLKVFNESNQVLSVKTVYRGGGDTAVKEIQPYTNEAVVVLSGLGNKKDFECCPCEITFISVRSSAGQIKKDPAKQENWVIPNKSKLKKFGEEPVKCELHITQDDL